MSSSSSLILPPGATLGGFEIEDVLGVGGMAVVYRAVQLSLGRRVALKVLNPRLAADLTFRERFRREGALVAALDHPNVIPVYDFGEAEGRLYLAMRLVDGVTLADRMLDSPLTPTETVDVIRHVGSALDAAHDSGLLHRDIKPQNILLSHAGAVYLADFGVAKMAGSPDLTHTGGFLGSVTYVSPEHIRGDAVGPPADVYALATVAYECLAGRTPFRRDTEAGVIHAHLTDPPPALEAGPEPAGADITRALLAGLEKDPTLRTQGAGAFARELSVAVAGASAEIRSRRPGFPPVVPGDELDAVPASETVVIDAPPTEETSPSPAAEAAASSARPEHTIHDRRRDELVRPEARRSRGELLFRVLPFAALLIAIAVPIGVLQATKEDPVPTSEVGPLELTPVAGWRSAGFKTVGADAAMGLALAGGTRWTSPDRKSTITVAALAEGSRLSPTGLGDGERVAQVTIPDGSLRRWSVGDPAADPNAGAADAPSTPASTPAPVTGEEPAAPVLRSAAVGVGEAGPVAVLCAGPPAQVKAPCDALLVTVAAKDGKLAADPVGPVGKAIADAIASAEKIRSTTLLPSKDRTARGRRAKLLSRAYAASAKALTDTVKARPWDQDVGRVQSALTLSSSAYARIASAAAGKDRSRDAAARDALRSADDRLAEAVGRLGRRGYVLRG